MAALPTGSGHRRGGGAPTAARCSAALRFGPVAFAALLVAGAAGAQQPDDLGLALPPDEFLTATGCAEAVEAVRADAASSTPLLETVVLLQLGRRIDDAEILCDAGHYGAAGVLLELVRVDLERQPRPQ